MERTFVLGPGKLICPNGEEFDVTEFTFIQGDPIELKDDRGEVYHMKPATIPVRIEFRNKTDGQETQG